MMIIIIGVYCPSIIQLSQYDHRFVIDPVGALVYGVETTEPDQLKHKGKTLVVEYTEKL